MALASSRSPRLRALMIGWLYADLMLVLLIAAMGNVKAEPERPSPTPTRSSPSPTPKKPSPTPAPTKPPKAGLDPEPITFTVPVQRQRLLDGDANTERSLQRRVERKLEQKVYKRLGRQGIPEARARVGLMITFGFDNNLGQAQQVARRANRLTKQAEPSLFRKSIVKSYGSTNPANKVDFEVYVYQ